MQRIRKLLLENKAWSQGHLEIDSEYFKKIAQGQNPEFLWIGCSDSRVHPDEMTNTRLGEMFMHRNIANMAYPDDNNTASVIEYGVKYLKVKYIIVCGHTSCGGVAAAFEGIDNPLLAKWISSIRETKEKYKPKTPDELAELNVEEQVRKICEMSVVKEAMASETQLKVVGWMYDMKTGLVKAVNQCESDRP